MNRFKTLSLIAALFLVLLTGCVDSNESGDMKTISFDKDTAKSFEYSGLTCYVPESWTVGSFDIDGEQNDFIKAGLCDNDGNAITLYTAYVFDSEEWDSFDSFLSDIEKELDNVDSPETVDISGCDNAVLFEKISLETEDELETIDHGVIVECGDKYFYLLIQCRDKRYNNQENMNVFTEILKSPDYSDYAKEHPSKSKKETTTKPTTTATKPTTTTTTTTTSTTRATTNSSSSNGLGTEVTDSKEKSDVWICAMDVAKSDLVSPSTAKFCKENDAKVYHQNGSQYVVLGYVDSQNAYGATIRSNFCVWLTMTKHGYKDGYVEFDSNY